MGGGAVWAGLLYSAAVNERRITGPQWKALIAAWLGWMFDGLDGYLYVLVAGPFVAILLNKPQSDPEVAFKGAVILGFFLFGWAAGGAIFGRVGDRLGGAAAPSPSSARRPMAPCPAS